MKKISFLAVILLLSVSAFAILPPGNIQAAFKKMYPKANGIAWSQDDGYYCANFDECRHPAVLLCVGDHM